VDWVSLERVADFLRKRGVHDGELTCYHANTIPLYQELEVAPSTRYIYFHNALLMFPGHGGEIRAELAGSRQRFLVTNLREAGLTTAQAAAGQPQALPPAFPEHLKAVYPWSEPIVFRAGRYVVHDVTGRPGSSGTSGKGANSGAARGSP